MHQVPIIEDNGKVVNDSFDIALYLERTYPDRPSLFGGPGGAAMLVLLRNLAMSLGDNGLFLITQQLASLCACRALRGLDTK